MKAILDEPLVIENNSRNEEQTFVDVNSDLQSIIIDAPAPNVYRHLLRFENLPRFKNKSV